MTPSFLARKITLLFAVCLVGGALPARALIHYDSGSNSITYNTTDPGATNTTVAQTLWNHVAQVRGGDGVTPDASAVYIGNGYLLTANHVSGTRYFIMGQEYLPDTAFGTNGQKTITNASNQGLDLKIIKLTTLPPLPGIPMVSSTDSVVSKTSLLIGWGVGKGTPVASQGWLWGDSSTAAKRWGANTTSSQPYTETNNPNTYLYTFFNRSLFLFYPYSTNDVCGITLGDSGAGLFQKINGTWKLAGICDAVSVFGRTYYDNDTTTPGDQPDPSFFIDLQIHSADVQRQIPAPVPVKIPWFVPLAFALLGARALISPSAPCKN